MHKSTGYNEMEVDGKILIPGYRIEFVSTRALAVEFNCRDFESKFAESQRVTAF